MKLKKDLRSNACWQNRLQMLAQPHCVTALEGIRRGIEREALRVKGDASLATTSHPASLGSALTHAQITTDYAEAMMELITPVGDDAQTTMDLLSGIHRHVYRYLGEELLWPLSMPCTVESEDEIKLAHYGNSNAGKMKTLYRQGLKNRYGSMMQVIAGIHYNFSMPDHFWTVWQQIKGDHQPLQDFISDSYLGLIRNFLRIGWLIPYLFGASPAVDSSFLNNSRRTVPLETLGRGTHYLPKATSLRMSGVGYNSQVQDQLEISYNSLNEFVSSLRHAANQPNAAFKKIGVKRCGEYRQLNANTLQVEGELYAPIRPKRVTRGDEKLSEALHLRGIEYVEVRSLDVNPYAETGICLEQVHFLDVFLTHCLLKNSPALSHHQHQVTKQNLNRVATRGRDLSQQLQDGEQSRSLREWGGDIFTELTQTAQLLDCANQVSHYQRAVETQQCKLLNPDLTPSAKLLRQMKGQGLTLCELGVALAEEHRCTLKKVLIPRQRWANLQWRQLHHGASSGLLNKVTS